MDNVTSHTPRHIKVNIRFRDLTIVDTTISEVRRKQCFTAPACAALCFQQWSLILKLTFMSCGVCSLVTNTVWHYHFQKWINRQVH